MINSARAFLFGFGIIMFGMLYEAYISLPAVTTIVNILILALLGIAIILWVVVAVLLIAISLGMGIEVTTEGGQ